MKGSYFWILVASLTPGTIGFGDAASQEVLNGASQCTRPNVVFILTDDQDTHLNSLDYMPHVRTHLLEQGTYFQKHYCTTAVCCPSRVTLWTGKAAHNTNITDVNPPYGKSCVEKPSQLATS
jgi:arylsulfatase A-like enzyme